MGAVWLAERTDGLMKRPVALKLPHYSYDTARRAGLVERLARERDILASLNHPNIATLYDAGIADNGQPYLAIEYVEGFPIDEYCRERPVDLKSRLGLFVQIANAVAYAHAKLALHRDLKPANILVTAEAQVRLLDFGIAKLMDEGQAKETRLTELSGRALTPDYASPEQILGEPLSVASDVYSLGVILYELISGQRPYTLRRESRGALEDAIVQADPMQPSEVADTLWRKSLRGDLDTIVLKALKKAPAQRYATVNALAEDVQRYLADRPVQAQRDSRWYRLSKFVARNKLPVGAASAVAVAVLAGAGVALWQAKVAFAEQARAEEVKEFIASIFRDANPYADEGKAVSANELLNHARGQIDLLGIERPEVRVELLNLVGSGFMGLGDTAAAEAVGRQALDESVRVLGPDHAQTVQARLLMVDVHRFRGRTAQMGQELALLRPIVTRAASTRPLDLVRTLIASAHLAVDEERINDAVVAATEALGQATALLGIGQPTTAAAATILAEASMLLKSGVSLSAADKVRMMQTANRSLNLVLQVYRKRPNHPQVLEMRSVHARTLYGIGERHRGIAKLTQVLNDQREAFGPSSMVVAYTMGDLAEMERAVGDLSGALANHDMCLNIIAQHLQPDSREFAVYQLQRGISLLAARRGADALRDLSAAKNTLQSLLGPSSLPSVNAQSKRAVALAFLGRVDEAYREVGPLNEPTPELKELDWPLYTLGLVQRLAGDVNVAIQTQQNALARIPAGSNSDWNRMRILRELGLAQVELHRNDEAVVTLQRVQALSKALEVDPSPATADAAVGLGRARLGLGNLAEALPELEVADHFWKGFDAKNRWAGEAAFWLARCQESLGHRAAAREAYARAARILTKSPFAADATLLKLARRGWAEVHAGPHVQVSHYQATIGEPE
jgi:serine/threonine-protein kinase